MILYFFFHAASAAGCNDQPFITQLQLYLHRSPPQQPQDESVPAGSGSGASVEADEAVFAAAQEALRQRLSDLQVPAPMAADLLQPAVDGGRDPQIRTALAECWQVSML